MPDFKFEIIQSIACLGAEKNGWTKELNYISWNDGKPKYDIRAWSSDHTKMGKGITLTATELNDLKDVLSELNIV